MNNAVLIFVKINKMIKEKLMLKVEKNRRRIPRHSKKIKTNGSHVISIYNMERD